MILWYRLNLNTIITKYLSSNCSNMAWIPIDPCTIVHTCCEILWLAHWSGTMSFSIDVLRYFPPALSYFLEDKCPRNTVSWSAAKSGQILEKVIFYWAFLIRFPKSFGIIRHFCSNRKTLIVSAGNMNSDSKDWHWQTSANAKRLLPAVSTCRAFAGVALIY